MKAILIDFNFMTRIVVPDEFTEAQAIDASIKNMDTRLISDFNGEFKENVSLVEDDTEVPFDPKNDSEGTFGYYNK